MKGRHTLNALGIGAALFAASALAPTNVFSQALDVEHFAGYEQWPLYTPGDLRLEGTDRVGDQRIAYEALFGGGDEPAVMNLWMDVLDVSFKGRAAQWIQWTFSDNPGEGTGVPTLDALVVDRATQEMLFRVHPGAVQSEWSRPYETIQFRGESIHQIQVNESGEAEATIVEVDTPMYEFATLGFLFPFMELRAGDRFRLATYHHPSRAERHIPVHVVGRTTLPTEGGEVRDVWAVQVGSTTGETLVTYYVRDEAPYFYGWHYQRVSDGASLFKMTYRDWLSTEVGR